MRKPLHFLILSIAIISLIGAFIPQVQAYLAFSWEGMKHLYFWQFFTYVFVEAGPFSLSFALQLAFNLYILWLFGSSLIDFSRVSHFLILFFGAALFAALSVLPFHGYLAGSAAAIYAVLTAWAMINQGSQLLLFFALPFKAEWLILAIIAFSIFVDIMAGLWITAASLIASVLFGYLFALIAWRRMSPFAIFYPFEKRVLRLLEKKRPAYHHSKIYDIKSGAPILNDAQFMDAMLDQISRLGEKSLTPEEKKRMRKISKKKK